VSSIRVNVDGDMQTLINRLRNMENVDFRGVMRAVGEGLRTSVFERFDRSETPDGHSWRPSIRVRESGGKTLIRTAGLRASIHVESGSEGVAVGTNDVRAATHQFGDVRTIKARDGKRLKFKIQGKWKTAKSVTIHVPARPFLGVNEKDEREIKNTLEAAVENAMEG